MRPRNLAVLLGAGLAFSAAACGGDPAPASRGAAAPGGEKPVTITVACQPPRTDQPNRRAWDEDVAEFQRLHPHITVKSTDQQPCYDPKTFAPKLAAGTVETVFRVPVTDAPDVIRRRQALDVTPYLGEIKNYGDLPETATAPWTSGGAVYGVPTSAYAVGLIYNRALFAKAGLDPDSPPRTWDGIRAAAKKISALGPGYVGYGEYSGQNTGGWHFVQALYGRGGEAVTADGTKAAFNSPEGRAVLQFLKDLRWTDDSMGTKLMVGWESLMMAMGSGKVGMMLGAPDAVPDIVTRFKGRMEDYGITTFPEAKATLSGGEGFMINPRATPEEARAGMKWIDHYWLTPGRGTFDFERGKAIGNPVGLPVNVVFGDSPSGRELAELQQRFASLPVRNFASYTEGAGAIPLKVQPPKAQEIFAVLDVPMSAVLSRRDADIDRLLADAEAKVNALLAAG
ncbi:extracellular solute-binding protein [Planomonospora alba]|uniref:Extracellular solute-binding protein n=1 Tax=Planomonospora alba TaxID=161354 RepID=A0ABP6N6Z5_9ACTN